MLVSDCHSIDISSSYSEDEIEIEATRKQCRLSFRDQEDTEESVAFLDESCFICLENYKKTSLEFYHVVTTKHVLTSIL